MAPDPADPELDRSLRARALAWLAQREHSRVELRRRLLAHALVASGSLARPEQPRAPGSPDACPQGPPAATKATPQRIEAVLDWLEANRYLSESRFIESRVRVRAQRFGNLRIRQEIAEHGVALSSEAQAALRDSEFERACAVRAKKFPRRPAVLSDMAKQARFLASRGFSSDVIRRVLREASREDRGADAADGQSDARPARLADR